MKNPVERDKELRKTVGYLKRNKRNMKVMESAMITAGIFTTDYSELKKEVK